MRALAALLLAGVLAKPHLAVAQRISLGIVGGSAVTNDYSGTGTRIWRWVPTGGTVTQTGTTSAYQPIIGPKIEILLTDRLSFEANAIRRQSEWRSRDDFDPPWNLNGTLTPTLSQYATDVSWEVPLLIKYRLPVLKSLGSISPFVEAGPSLRPWLYSQGDAHAGVTAGAGFRITSRRITFEPAVRYTRWGTPRLNFPRAKSDQIELLIGLAGPPSSGRPEVLGKKLRFGFIGGFGLTGDFQAKEGYASALSKMAGLTIGTVVTDRLSVEMNAIYRPRILSEMQRATVLTWEFPVLASYKVTASRLSPFLEAGPAFRSAGNTNNSNPSRFGAAAGIGVQARWRAVHFVPRIRYTRWAADPPSDFPPQQPFSRRNQVDALVGFSF